MPMPGATAKGSFAYRPISNVITKQTSTVAVSTPLNAMPVPGVERIDGFTTTMKAIVKKVVMPAIASVRRLRLATGRVICHNPRPKDNKPEAFRLRVVAFSLQGVPQLLRADAVVESLLSGDRQR